MDGVQVTIAIGSMLGGVAAVGAWITSLRTKRELMKLKVEINNQLSQVVNLAAIALSSGGSGGGGGSHGGTGGGGGGGPGAPGGDGGSINNPSQ